MVGYFRVFIKNYAHVAKPLTVLTSTKNQNFQLNQRALEAYEKLKTVLAEDVTLKIVDFSKPFTLATDASDVAIGAVLSQPDGKAERPIQFFSRVLNEHERNYPVHERELLALTNAIAEFETYLKGRKFTVLTDSQCIVYLFTNTNKNKRLVRQAINILDSNFDIKYQPDKLNVVADALSRIKHEDFRAGKPVSISDFIETLKPKPKRALTRSKAGAFDPPSNASTPSPTITCNRGTTTKNDEYEYIFSAITLSNGSLLEKLTANKNFKKTSTFVSFSQSHSLITINTLPIKQHELRAIAMAIAKHVRRHSINNIAINTDLKAKQLFEFKHYLHETFGGIQISITLCINQIIELTDPLEIQQALHTHHHLRLGGHAGLNRMIKTMKNIYTWQNMVKDIKNYVSNCSICERAKVTKYTKTPLLITDTPEHPFDHVYIDYVGPIRPPSQTGQHQNI